MIRFTAIVIQTIFLILSFIGCSSPQIKVEKFKDFIEINKGENANLSWSFENADKVKVEGIENEYSANDSVLISPLITKSYLVTAYNKDMDSISLPVVIMVSEEDIQTKGPIHDKENNDTEQSGNIIDGNSEINNLDDLTGLSQNDMNETNLIKKENFSDQNDMKTQIQRGPVLLKHKTLEASFDKNEYLSGVVTATRLAEPYSLKITRTLLSKSRNSILLRAMPIDEFGNYLTGFNDNNNKVNWIYKNSCQPENGILNIIEKKYSENLNLDIALSLDISAALSDASDVIVNIKDFMEYLSPSDNIMFSAFNQNYIQMFALSPAEKALWEIENMDLPEPSGLNSLYKSAYLNVDKLSNGFHDNRICIMITFNSDNSSIIYTANDVAKIANELNVPVYIIGIGDAIESYTLRYICSATGGKFYHLMSDEKSDIKKVLTEIALSQKGYYEFDVPLNLDQTCDVLTSTLTLETYDSKISDKVNNILNYKLQYIKYQAVTNFDYHDIIIKKEYEDILNSLAFVLKGNPDFAIQLIGHSGLEGNEKENYQYSLDRAKAVKNYLTGKGISENQIKISAEGYHRPIYYLQTSEWEQKYNRRVEIRWLDPSIKPYEIKAELFESEEDALKKVEFWEQNGYKSYYDRYIINNSPAYQVKIWGYGAEDEAFKAVTTINTKFKKKFSVE